MHRPRADGRLRVAAFVTAAVRSEDSAGEAAITVVLKLA
jgi:hypothetical protein